MVQGIILVLAQLVQPTEFAPTHITIIQTTNPKSVVREGVARSVTIKGSDFHCSGFVLETNLVLTAGHCFDDDTPKLEVDGKPASVVKAGRLPDLMLLATETAKFKRLNIRDAEVGDEVILVGNYTDIQGIVSFGHISFLSPLSFLSDVKAYPGISGSPIYGLDGSLVGIETKYTGMDTKLGGIVVFAQAVRGCLIKKFLEEK
jgi:V8-like Glu-specific endopeptidase